MVEISIVIPAYNSEEFISDAIESVIAQTSSDWELIIVDDESSDRTFEIAVEYAEQDERISAHTHKNVGFAATCNRGFSLVGSETTYVMFLDNDDYLEPDALETLKILAESTPCAVGAYGLPRHVDRNGNSLINDITEASGYERLKVADEGLVPVPENEATTFSSLVIWPCINTGGQILMKHEALKAIGGYDPHTGPGADWDVWIRLTMHGDLPFVRKIVMSKRTHENNVSSQGSVVAVSEPSIRYKLATSDICNEQQKRIAQRGHYYSCFIKLKWAKEDFAKRNYVDGCKQVYRAMKSYKRYLQTPYVY